MPFYSFVVTDEECPDCGHDTSKQDAIHFQANDGSKLWTYASANPPFGTVSEDEMDETYPSEEDCPDLILSTKDVFVTCSKCGATLSFEAEEEIG